MSTSRCGHFDLAASEVMLEFRVYDQVPFGKKLTVDEIKDSVKIDPAKLMCVLRLLKKMYIWRREKIVRTSFLRRAREKFHFTFIYELKLV